MQVAIKVADPARFITQACTLKVGQPKFTVNRHEDFDLHAGGRSFSIFQTSRECWKGMLEPRSRRGPAVQLALSVGGVQSAICLLY